MTFFWVNVSVRAQLMRTMASPHARWQEQLAPSFEAQVVSLQLTLDPPAPPLPAGSAEPPPSPPPPVGRDDSVTPSTMTLPPHAANIVHSAAITRALRTT